MPAIFIIGLLLGSSITGGVKDGAIVVDKKAPYVHIDATKADIKYEYPN